jgi:hypothetical protein
MGDCVGNLVISSIGVGATVPVIVGAALLLGAGAEAAFGAEAEGGATAGALVSPSSWATTTTTAAHPIQARITIRANESMLTGDRSSKELNVVKRRLRVCGVVIAHTQAKSLGSAKKAENAGTQ